MEFFLFSGEEDDEYNGVGLVEIPKIFATQEENLDRTALFKRV